MIKTERLILKDISDADKDDLIGILKDDTVKKTYMVPDLNNAEEEERIFGAYRRLAQTQGRIAIGIFLSDKLIGFINDTGIENGAIELGWAVHPSYHNRGYATEAVSALTKKLFEDGFCEIVAGAFEENPASIKVMTKCGMTKLDKEEDIEYRGKTHRCVYYSIKK